MELETEVLKIIADYEAAIFSKDNAVIANLMSFPFEVIVKGRKKHYYQNQAKMMARLETFRAIHKKLGIAAISREVVKVHQTHADEALAFTLDTARNAEGEVVTSWRTSFYVKRTPQGVKLVKADSTDQNRAMTELGFPLYEAKSVSFS